MATKAKAPAPAKIEKNELFEADELVALARHDIERGELDQALGKLKQAMSDTTPPAEAFAMGARLYAQLGLWERAKALFQQYLEAEPNAVNEAFQLGMVHFDSGQIDEAVNIWESLLKNHPTHPPALFYRSLAKHQVGQTAEARHTLDVLIKSAAPDNLYFNRAKELLQTIEGQQAMPAASRNAAITETLRVAPKDAYKTEH
jgi:tetratricopeptide (TPR) repeat protein